MNTSGSDPTATRPPWEGGWLRSGAVPPVSDGADASAYVPTEPDDRATWNPIPTFRTTDDRTPTAFGPAATYGWPPVPPSGLWVPVSRLPEAPVEYPQLLRGPTRAWWRPVMSLFLFVGLFMVLSVLPLLVLIAYGLAARVGDVGQWLDAQLADGALMDPGGYLYLNLSLVVLIPAALLSTWAAHRIRPRYVSSVAGGLRWRWLLRCLVVLAPLWAIYLAVSTITDPPQSPRSDQWVALLAIGVLLTPWQAAAEEYAFRGWLAQNLGSYFARPLLAFAVPAVVVAAAFAAAHGSPDPWILGDLAVFSLTASIMTWRTGGLEAAIVMHTVNNVGIDVIVNTVGGFEEAMVGADTTGTPLSFVVSVVIHGTALALVLWQARRAGVDRHFRPLAVTASGVG